MTLKLEHMDGESQEIEQQMDEKVIVFIGNTDVIVTAMLKQRSILGEVVESMWRVDGVWCSLNETERRVRTRSTMDYPIRPYAVPMLLAKFDAGQAIDASLVEIGMKEEHDIVRTHLLGHTKDQLPLLLKARQRREEEPSELTVWLAKVIDYSILPTAGELLSALDVLLEERAAQGPPIPKAMSQRLDETFLAIAWDDKCFWTDGDSEGWAKLHLFVSALITLTDDVVVVSVRSPLFDDGVYVQSCKEDDGALHLEAVSNEYLEPPLPPDAIDTLHELGWSDPPGDGLPNYVQVLEGKDTAPGHAARILVETLRRVYRTRPGDPHLMEPNALVRQMLRGDFGPSIAMNPDLPLGRQGRLVFGISFPNDIAD